MEDNNTESRGGRPTLYNEDVAIEICALIAEGKSLRKICEQQGMPDKSTVCRWLFKHEEFRDQYARAREAQAEILAEEIIDIADDGSNDEMPHPVVEGATTTNWDNIHRTKIRIDARKWVATKLLPKKYGDKQEIENTGDVSVHVTRTVVSEQKKTDTP